MKKKKTSINLYLLKDILLSANEAIKDGYENIKLKNVTNGNVVLFYQNKPEHVPSWVNEIIPFCQNDGLKLTSSTCSAVLVIKPDIAKRYFALCFGYGRNLLKSELIEEDFGLKIALNVIGTDKIKSIDVKNLDTIIKNVRMDNSKETDFGNFGANIDKDILNGVIGSRKDKESFKYSERICGKEAIKFNTELDVRNLPSLCVDLYNIYNSKNYKKHFSWIDHVRPIRKKKALIETLDSKMLEAIKKKEWEKIWLSPPEVIDWYNKEGFRYTSKGDVYEDIKLAELLVVKDKSIAEIDLNFLHSNKIYCRDLSNETVSTEWSVYKCIYFEDEIDNDKYILVGGNWYLIDTNYANGINDQLSAIKDYSGECNFIDYDCLRENEYNIDLCNANSQKALLLDQKVVAYGGGHSSIELCDILFNNNEFIHVKRYSGSSTLSHLFFQGLTSAFLLKTDPIFLKKANEELKLNIKKGSELSYAVVYAIAAASKGKDIKSILPFFSKVTLIHACNNLVAYGYNVMLKKIPLNKEAIEQKRLILNAKSKKWGT